MYSNLTDFEYAAGDLLEKTYFLKS